jgi:uncharacterized protein
MFTPCAAITFRPEAGGLGVFLSLILLGFESTVGPGTQYVSWNHDTDYIRTIDFLITHSELEGPVNLASPDTHPNRDLTRILRESWRTTRAWLPQPEWWRSARF